MAADNAASFQETLQLQISEIEMLQSMFPNEEEFILDDESALSDIQSFLDGKSTYTYLHARLGFTLKLKSSEKVTL